MDVTSAEPRLKALMLEGLAGNAAAYRTLMHDLAGHLRSYFGRRMGRTGSADVEDLVQETLLAVHARRTTYDPARPFTVWLHAVARYKLIDYFRQRRMRPSVPIDDVADLFAPDAAEPAMARLDVDRLLATMPARSRALIQSVKLDGRSIAETAAEQGLSEAAVKVGVHRGVRALVDRMRGQVERGDK